MTITTYYNEDKLPCTHDELNELIGTLGDFHNEELLITIRPDLHKHAHYGTDFVCVGETISEGKAYHIAKVDTSDQSIHVFDVTNSNYSRWIPYVMIDAEELIEQVDSLKVDEVTTEEDPFFVQAEALHSQVKREIEEAIAKLNGAIKKANAINRTVYSGSSRLHGFECTFEDEYIAIRSK